MIGYIFAALSGGAHGLMNVADKFVVSHRVKRAFGYTIYVGAFNLLLGAIIALFLNWSKVTLTDLWLPIIVGVFYGASAYLYYAVMDKEDASHSIGLLYLYPLIVALLSFIFLGERLQLVQYAGIIITILGAILLSVRLHELKLKTSIWILLGFIVSTAIIEFLIKIAVSNISAWNGSVVTFMAFGATVLFGLFVPSIRADAKSEWHNAKWTGITETLNYLGNLFVYTAMTILPATIVSSVCATEPLFVLFFEKLAHKKFGGMARDEKFGSKAIAICCIVIGIALMYLA